MKETRRHAQRAVFFYGIPQCSVGRRYSGPGNTVKYRECAQGLMPGAQITSLCPQLFAHNTPPTTGPCSRAPLFLCQVIRRLKSARLCSAVSTDCIANDRI